MIGIVFIRRDHRIAAGVASDQGRIEHECVSAVEIYADNDGDDCKTARPASRSITLGNWLRILI
jgi:hypothetical protein